MKLNIIRILTMIFVLALVGLPTNTNAISDATTIHSNGDEPASTDGSSKKSKKAKRKLQRLKKRVNRRYKKMQKRVNKWFKRNGKKQKNEKERRISWGTIFLLALTATFVVLKLTGVIAWSWWWVFSPLWIPIALFLLIFIIALIIVLIVGTGGSTPPQDAPSEPEENPNRSNI